MSKQSKQNIDRYNEVFPTIIRGLLENHPVDGHTTTYKALGEAIGVRQQTISLYSSGQTMPTADVLVKLAQFFGVSIDYLLTGVSSGNKDYHEELGLSEKAIELLKRGKAYYTDKKSKEVKTVPYLDELLSDGEFYDFLENMAEQVERLRDEFSSGTIKKKYKDLNVEGYFIWKLQMDVEEFIKDELNKLGLDLKIE